MRLPRTAYTEQPWQSHRYAHDFRVEDVWSFRTPGAGPDDFPVLVDTLRACLLRQPAPVRLLMAARRKLGTLLGWDSDRTGLDARVRPLRDRIPDELRRTTRLEGAVDGTAFSPVYDLPDETLHELANATVHAAMHLGLVPVGDGCELRMAVLVKPNGRFGRLYMALIAPFRYLIVYPALTRQFERAWRQRG